MKIFFKQKHWILGASFFFLENILCLRSYTWCRRTSCLVRVEATQQETGSRRSPQPHILTPSTAEEVETEKKDRRRTEGAVKTCFWSNVLKLMCRDLKTFKNWSLFILSDSSRWKAEPWIGLEFKSILLTIHPSAAVSAVCTRRWIFTSTQDKPAPVLVPCLRRLLCPQTRWSRCLWRWL